MGMPNETTGETVCAEGDAWYADRAAADIEAMESTTMDEPKIYPAQYTDGQTVYAIEQCAQGAIAAGEVLTVVESYPDRFADTLYMVRTYSGRDLHVFASSLSAKPVRPRVDYTDMYTVDGRISMPDVRLDRLPPGHVAEALRGSVHTLAVLDDNGTCVGWIRTEALGYETAAEWVAATNKV